jgi:hypothetical protein
MVELYIDRGKPKNSEKKQSQCHFVHHKSHMVANPGLHGEKPANNDLSHGTALTKSLVVQIKKRRPYLKKVIFPAVITM